MNLTRMDIFKDENKLTAQNALREAVTRAIQNTDGTEIDDVIYVLQEQVVFWQLALFERLNGAR